MRDCGVQIKNKYTKEQRVNTKRMEAALSGKNRDIDKLKDLVKQIQETNRKAESEKGASEKDGGAAKGDAAGTSAGAVAAPDDEDDDAGMFSY